MNPWWMVPVLAGSASELWAAAAPDAEAARVAVIAAGGRPSGAWIHQIDTYGLRFCARVLP